MLQTLWRTNGGESIVEGERRGEKREEETREVTRSRPSTDCVVFTDEPPSCLVNGFGLHCKGQ